MAYTSSYGGKPSGTLTVPSDGEWHRLDADTADPTHSGAEAQEVYLHCDCVWDGSNRCGVIRVRYTRESGDHTAYQDFTVAPGMPDFLITHNHHERGQAGQGGRWWVEVKGGLSRVNITTRYSKNQTAY
jgi:hypothetical protein